MSLLKEDDNICYPINDDLRPLKCRRIFNRYNVHSNNFTISSNIIYSCFKKMRFLILMTCVSLYIYFLVMILTPIEKIPVIYNSHVIGMKDFLVWSDQCKIPNIDPYEPDIIKYVRRIKYEPCSGKKPLSYVQYDSNRKQYILNINKNRKIYHFSLLDCCYQNIVRNETGIRPDYRIKLSECVNFNKSIAIPNIIDNILVKCKIKKRQTYIHGHPMIPERPKIRDRLEAWKKHDTKRPPSILMIGIDSISRTNLIREMPKTAQKLYNNGWLEMSGYNKIDDNTLPNLIAILTGYNIKTASKICNDFNNCPFIWKLFRDHGYVTAYGEDETLMSTFNIREPGFKVSPVDYYLRPFMIAAEHNFPAYEKSGLKFCLGYQHSADYVIDYAIELATRYENNSYFGFFWTNTFSHNDISDCSSMDFKIAGYLEKLSNRGILNESVVIFFSDHGIRFGEARESVSGYYEERLPFMFIWLPEWLKIKHPEFVNGLTVNKNRLTNPFDIHMTLKNLLELSGRTLKNLPKATDCPNCQSLLRPVPYNRSCLDIGIDDHWCTCFPYQRVQTNTDLNKQLALFVVDQINNYLESYQNGSIAKSCYKLVLHFIAGIYQANIIGNNYPKNLVLYRVLVRTLPGSGLFEATIRHKTDTKELEITGKISRLNTYSANTDCVIDSSAKMYCFCIRTYSSNRTIYA